MVLMACVEPDEHRLADQEVADVEFDDLRQRGDRLGAGVVEAVAGMDFEAETLAQASRPRGCAAIRRRLRAVSPSSERMAPGAGVDFDHRRAERGRRLDLRRLGGDEQRHPDAGRAQFGDPAA